MLTELIVGFIMGTIFGMTFIVGMILVHFHDKLMWTAALCPFLRCKQIWQKRKALSSGIIDDNSQI